MGRQLAGSTSDLFAPLLALNGPPAVPGRLVQVESSDVGLHNKHAMLLDVEAPFASVQHGRPRCTVCYTTRRFRPKKSRIACDALLKRFKRSRRPRRSGG